MEIPVALPIVPGPPPGDAAINRAPVSASAPAIPMAAGTPPTVARLRFPRPGPAAAR